MEKWTAIITGTDKDDVREKFHKEFPYGKIISMEVTEVTLEECPVGLFRYGEEIVLKTEYSDEAGCKCYLIRTGNTSKIWKHNNTVYDMLSCLLSAIIF